MPRPEVRWRGTVDGPPERWPARYAPLAFLAAFGAAFVATWLMFAGAAVAGNNVRGGNQTITIASLVAQDTAFIVVALLFAFRTWPTSLRDLGLTRLAWRTAVGWTVAAITAWYAFAFLYALLVTPNGEQETLDAIGADRGTGLLVLATVLIVLVAPFAEEIFFRGLCYRALRNRFSRWSAAAIVGGVFGAIHYTSPDTLPLLVPLAVLGALFCLLYERTGSLYPSIALHIVNNAIALAVTADSAAAPIVAAMIASLGLAACLTFGVVRPLRS